MLPDENEIRLLSTPLRHGVWRTDVAVPGIHCGGCISRIESCLSREAGVRQVRVNLARKRVRVDWLDSVSPAHWLQQLHTMGYKPNLLAGDEAGNNSGQMPQYLRALAVAGFAAGNIMLLSVSVWSGADAATRHLFHWLSALIALPAVMYSGRVFYVSAWRALRHGHTNMDVPITVGILLTCLLGLYDTVTGGPQVFFEASVMLVFFLLIGRTLDYSMRDKAASAVQSLARMAPRGATVIDADGGHRFCALADIQPGDLIQLEAGARVPVDALVESGHSELDCAVVSGESKPEAVTPGATVLAGTLNLLAPLTLRASSNAAGSFLSRLVRIVEDAEATRSKHRLIADRAATLYAPLVHLAALASFIGWYWVSADLHHSASIAIAVLIITCPCAIGLAVPMVQVMAGRRLFEQGVLLREGAALERLACIDHVMFDKTGTLTQGLPHLAQVRCAETPERPSVTAPDQQDSALQLAGSLARASRHPYARALVAGAARLDPQPVSRLQAAAISSSRAKPLPCFVDIDEIAGCGIEGRLGQKHYRLGKASWALDNNSRAHDVAETDSHAATVLACDGQLIALFLFTESLRAGAHCSIAALKRDGYRVEIVSGDESAAVKSVADALDIDHWQSGMDPRGKTTAVQTSEHAGRQVLMVGDGLNDAGALSAASVSMAPGSAADLGRNMADFVFLRDDLRAINGTLAVARQARLLVRQNLTLAIAYNALALPFAVLGFVTPLVAALAMSASSVIVVANAMRLRPHSTADRIEPAGWTQCYE